MYHHYGQDINVNDLERAHRNATARSDGFRSPGVSREADLRFSGQNWLYGNCGTQAVATITFSSRVGHWRALATKRDGAKRRRKADILGQCGGYAGEARRRVHLASILVRPPSGHRWTEADIYTSNRLPPDATKKPTGSISAWSSPSDPDDRIQ